jgi:hypothetical protein
MNTKLMFSSNDETWATPQDFFDKLNNEFRFTLDPCCSEHTAKCDKYYTVVENGIKLIRISDADKDWDAIKLKNLIESKPYPKADYISNLLDGRPPSKERRLEKDRERRKAQYQRLKELRKSQG